MVALSSGGDMVTEHRRSMEGLLTHVGTADCFTTLPHPALECGIVTAWWQCQVEANTAMRAAARGRATAGNLRSEFSVTVTHPIIG